MKARDSPPFLCIPSSVLHLTEPYIKLPPPPISWPLLTRPDETVHSAKDRRTQHWKQSSHRICESRFLRQRILAIQVPRHACVLCCECMLCELSQCCMWVCMWCILLFASMCMCVGMCACVHMCMYSLWWDTLSPLYCICCEEDWGQTCSKAHPQSTSCSGLGMGLDLAEDCPAPSLLEGPSLSILFL